MFEKSKTGPGEKVAAKGGTTVGEDEGEETQQQERWKEEHYNINGPQQQKKGKAASQFLVPFAHAFTNN